MDTFIGLLIIAGIIAAIIYRGKIKERNKNVLELTKIAVQLQDVLNKIDKVKTTGSKINNISKALNIIDAAMEYQEATEVIKNIEELRIRMIKVKKVLPTIDHIDKANRNKFKKKDKSELNNLLDALYEIKTNNITNRDFEIADVLPEDTNDRVTIQKIEARARGLGWEPD